MGKLIVIEGIDGSGKGTQSNNLVARLREKNIPVSLYSFPAYESTFFGNEIGAMLRGEYGEISSIPPKLAAILFASDRLEMKESIEKDLAEGMYVICDRYVGSNIAHQSAKMEHKLREEFRKWVRKLEYSVFGMPQPDEVVFMDVPVEISKELVLQKNARSYTAEKEDLHESDHDYMSRVYNVYKELSIIEAWKVINCVENGRMLPEDKVGEKLFEILSL